MKLLFATDGAKHSAAAIEMLKHFALKDGDLIKIVTVIDMAVPVSIDVFGLSSKNRLAKMPTVSLQRLLRA
jgi:nucleotide-binding universal stress UspA family protein